MKIMIGKKLMQLGNLSVWAFVISIIALAISILTYIQSRQQFKTDYDETIVLQPGVLPMQSIQEGKLPITLEITNTSKNNVSYLLRADTNMGCITGSNARPQAVPCHYESLTIQLSKPEAGNHKFKHTLFLDAESGAVKTSALAYMSDPDYFLNITAYNEKTGEILFRSSCFYVYEPNNRAFALYQPVLDPSGKSQALQAKCNG